VDSEAIKRYQEASRRLAKALDELERLDSPDNVDSAIAAAKRARTDTTELIRALATERDRRG
jgi:soluble cytochrome b562